MLGVSSLMPFVTSQRAVLIQKCVSAERKVGEVKERLIIVTRSDYRMDTGWFGVSFFSPFLFFNDLESSTSAACRGSRRRLMGSFKGNPACSVHSITAEETTEDRAHTHTHSPP